MVDKRFIPCKVLKKGNEFIPFWELDFYDDEKDMYGEGYKYGKSFLEVSYNDLLDCYWDCKDKKIIMGKLKDIYPDKTDFIIGEEVYFELNHSTFKESKIIDIKFENFETRILKVKDLKEYELKSYFYENEIKKLNINDIYEIRIYEPTYILKDGEEIKYSYKLKHKA